MTYFQRLTQKVSFFCVYKDCTGLMVGIEEDSVRYAHSGPSQRFLRGLRPLVSVGPLPLPVSAGGHASSIPTINPPELPPQKTKKLLGQPLLRLCASLPQYSRKIRSKNAAI